MLGVIIETIVLRVVMCIFLVSLLSVDAITKNVSVEAFGVANRVLGLLMVALGMEIMLSGAGDALRKMIEREISVLGC